MTDDQPTRRRKSDKVEFSVNVATLVSLLTGGGAYLYQDIQARAEERAHTRVLEERLIQLQSQLGEANARLAAGGK